MRKTILDDPDHLRAQREHVCKGSSRQRRGNDLRWGETRWTSIGSQVHVQPSFLPGRDDAFESGPVIPEHDPSRAREADDVLQLRRGYQWDTGPYPQRVNPADHQMSHTRVPRLALANVRPGVQLSGWRDGLSACSGIYPHWQHLVPTNRAGPRAHVRRLCQQIVFSEPSLHPMHPPPTKGWGHTV
jgi:hypothetical protein